MLAVDADPVAAIAQRHHIPERGHELSLAIREPRI
jgi:hypothetical protein